MEGEEKKKKEGTREICRGRAGEMGFAFHALEIGGRDLRRAFLEKPGLILRRKRKTRGGGKERE